MRRYLVREKQGIWFKGRLGIRWRRWRPICQLIYFNSYGDADNWPWLFDICVPPFELYLHLPFKHVSLPKRESYMRDRQRWGWSYVEGELFLYWGERNKLWRLPWLYKVSQHCLEVRRADGSWVPFAGAEENGGSCDRPQFFICSYRYVPCNGAIQERMATFYVGRVTWRPKWFCWARLFERQRQILCIRFDDLVGESVELLDDGCIACDWEMLPNESPERALRRMEKERVFR